MKGHKKVEDIDLASQEFPGIYELDDGSLMEAHEWLDPDWEEDEEPLGSVYYAIYRDYEEVDGGVMGYEEGDKMSDLSYFMGECNQPRIKRLIVREDEDGFDDLYEALEDEGLYKSIKGRFGLKNKRKGETSYVIVFFDKNLSYDEARRMSESRIIDARNPPLKYFRNGDGFQSSPFVATKYKTFDEANADADLFRKSPYYRNLEVMVEAVSYNKRKSKNAKRRLFG